MPIIFLLGKVLVPFLTSYIMAWVTQPSLIKTVYSATPLLGIYPKELKVEAQTDNCIPMFIAALFIKGRVTTHISIDR